MGPPNQLCGVVDSDHLDTRAVAEDDRPLHERPWHKRPSPWWLLPVLGLTTCLTSMTFAPRTEIFIRLVCEAYIPEIAFPPASIGIDQGTTPIFTANVSHIPSVLVFFDNGAEFLGNQFRVPRPTAQCRANPMVGRRVAALGTAISLTLGVLSCVTTSFWSKVRRS